VRILIACHPPLDSRFGAAAVALGLADGLRAAGHEAIAWSSSDSKGPVGYRLRERVRTEGPFDVVDAPAADLAECGDLGGAIRVARSVQPQHLYGRLERRAAFTRAPLRPSTWRAVISSLADERRIERGWKVADRVMCQGTLEYEWFIERSPALLSRAGVYHSAPPTEDRKSFRELRARRSSALARSGPERLLWIGRWSAHKGTEDLLRWLGSPAFRARGSQVTLAGCGDVQDARVSDLVRLRRVRLVPSFDREGLACLLSEHDAGLFTSVVEGWGLSVQEMLESGLPVYARDAGAIRDLRPFLSPLLRPFPPESNESIGAEDAAGAIRAVPWSLYEERFDWRTIARSYLESISSRPVRAGAER
jgi:glycosyltransferase involved in cell wall biosynthesis